MSFDVELVRLKLGNLIAAGSLGGRRLGKLSLVVDLITAGSLEGRGRWGLFLDGAVDGLEVNTRDGTSGNGWRRWMILFADLL